MACEDCAAIEKERDALDGQIADLTDQVNTLEAEVAELERKAQEAQGDLDDLAKDANRIRLSLE